MYRYNNLLEETLMKMSKTLSSTLIVAGLLGGVAADAQAQANEQFIGLPSYRVGAYAAGGCPK